MKWLLRAQPPERWVESVWAAALPDMLAVVRWTIRSRPSLSIATRRLRPTIFLPLS